MQKLWPYFFLVLLSGCFDKAAEVQIENVEINEIAKEAFIPKLVMSEVHEDFLKDTKTIAPVYMFTPVQIQFNELNENVLRKPAIKYSFPKGGGSIDLKDVVTGAGSFYMSFPAEQFDENHELMHLYYVSNSPVQEIDGESFGLGCGKVVDLKKSFKKLKKPDFLKLNTNDIRHLRVLAGRYIFVLRQAAQVYLSQVTISDSRYVKELCMGVE